MSNCSHTGLDREFPKCKVTNEEIRNCNHCKTPCKATGILQGFCAHCNVSKFTDSPVATSIKSKPQTKLEPRVTLGVAFTEVDSPDSFLTQFPTIPTPKPDPNQFQCSFCHQSFSLNLVTKTEGISEIRKIDRSEIWRDSDGNVQVKRDLGHLPTKVVACPDCAHLIKPLYKKDGTLKHKGAILPPIND